MNECSRKCVLRQAPPQTSSDRSMSVEGLVSSLSEHTNPGRASTIISQPTSLASPAVSKNNLLPESQTVGHCEITHPAGMTTDGRPGLFALDGGTCMHIYIIHNPSGLIPINYHFLTIVGLHPFPSAQISARSARE